MGVPSGWKRWPARHQKPDLVLLDVMIPQLDGLTFLMLPPRTATSVNAVVLLTGVSDEHTLNRARELGEGLSAQGPVYAGPFVECYSPQHRPEPARRVLGGWCDRSAHHRRKSLTVNSTPTAR